jgi:hypothetical protein
LGHALRRDVTLSWGAWDRVLSPGDPVLEAHIPEGEPMTPESCGDSLRQALEFFPAHFPERRFLGFGCQSWLLNPELAQLLPPTSNLTRFQREVYLYPIPSGGRDGAIFIFGEDNPDPLTAPRDTTLRRALLDHAAAGGRWRTSGMFLLTQDVEHYGTECYRSHWPETL